MSKVHEVDYPEEVAKRKAGLLRCFDALEAGDEDLNPKGGSQQKGKQRAGGDDDLLYAPHLGICSV